MSIRISNFNTRINQAINKIQSNSKLMEKIMLTEALKDIITVKELFTNNSFLIFMDNNYKNIPNGGKAYFEFRSLTITALNQGGRWILLDSFDIHNDNEGAMILENKKEHEILYLLSRFD